MKPISAFVNRVICGDCAGVMDEMPDESVDFVLTDPPHMARYRDLTGRTVRNDDNALWLFPAFAQIGSVLKDNPSAYHSTAGTAPTNSWRRGSTRDCVQSGTSSS